MICLKTKSQDHLEVCVGADNGIMAYRLKNGSCDRKA